MTARNYWTEDAEPHPDDVAALIEIAAAESLGLTRCSDCDEMKPNCSPNCDDCYRESSMEMGR